MWEFQHVGVTTYGSCGMWEVQHVGDAACGRCSMWEMQHVGVAACEGCSMWELQHVGVAACGSLSRGRSGMWGLRVGSCCKRHFRYNLVVLLHTKFLFLHNSLFLLRRCWPALLLFMYGF